MASITACTYLPGESQTKGMEFSHMLKGAWILPAVMFVALILATVPSVVFAADDNPFGRSMGAYFEGLPGVVPQGQQAKPDDYKCTSSIGYTSRTRSRNDPFRWDDVPTRLYHCKAANGTTYTGTRMPSTDWVPGISPHFLPR
jgi:hypothetical protein